LAGGKVGGFEWSEDFIERVKQSASDAIPAGFGPLSHANKVIDKYIEIPHGRSKATVGWHR
jgi:hypothetical protein